MIRKELISRKTKRPTNQPTMIIYDFINIISAGVTNFYIVSIENIA